MKSNAKTNLIPPVAGGSGRRFEWRVFGTEQGQRYEVYAPGLIQVAECLTAEGAKLVCDALNALPENNETLPPPATTLTPH